MPKTQTQKSLTRLLRELPDETLLDTKTKKVRFNRVYAAILKARGLVQDGMVKIKDLEEHDLAPNLSSLQRAVAKEASVRKSRLSIPLVRKGPTIVAGDEAGEPSASDAEGDSRPEEG